MLKETEIQELSHDLENVNYRYPSTTGSYNPKVMLFRSREFAYEKLPAVTMQFFPAGDPIIQGMNNLTEVRKGNLLFGMGEDNAIEITVRTKQKCDNFHGRPVARTYLDRIERRIKRQWQKKLLDYGAQIQFRKGFRKEYIGDWLPTNMHGYALTFNIVSRNEWDYLPEGTETLTQAPDFEDAIILATGAESMPAYQSVSGDIRMSE